MKNVKGQIRKVLNDDKIVPAVAQEILRTILYESETMIHEGMSIPIQGERKLHCEWLCFIVCGIRRATKLFLVPVQNIMR